MLEDVAVAPAMVPLRGIDVNFGAVTEALEAAERVTITLALEDSLEGQGLARTVVLADAASALGAMEDL